MTKRNSGGFSVIELLVIVAVVAIVGLLGYTIYNRQHKTTPAPPVGSKSNTTTASAPQINSTSDLDKAQAALDQTDPGSSNSNDTSQLNSQLSGF